MKTRLLLSTLAVILFTATAAMAQRTGLIKATYDTNFGKMSLSINLDTKQVTGFYGGDGKILAAIDDNDRITGAWVQKELGAMELDFTKDFKTFTGKFGVGTKLTGGVWKGTCISLERVDGNEKAPLLRKGIYEVEYNTEYGIMKLRFDFSTRKVKGTYGVNGTIEGSIGDNNRLIGTWGRVDRGRMEFDFTPDFTNFTGKWGEKNNTLTDGTWMGESIVITKVK